MPHKTMKCYQTNFSSSQKSAASAPGGAVNACKQLEDEIKKLCLRIKRHEDKIMSLKREDNGISRAILDLRDTLYQFHILERPMTERGHHPNGVSEMAGKVDDGNISREVPQIVLPEYTPADYASLEEIRKKELEREVLQDELQREVARLHNVKSEYLVKKNEYLQFVNVGHHSVQVQVPAPQQR